MTTLTTPTTATDTATDTHTNAATDTATATHTDTDTVVRAESTPRTRPGPADAGAETRTSRVTFGRLLSAEWFKFRTVRSNIYAILGAGAAAISLGMLFTSLSDTGEGPSRLANDGLSLSLGGFDLAQIIVAILGIALVAGEYQSGLIRAWFAAAPNRLQVLAAKAGVYSTVAMVTAAIAATVAFLAGQLFLPEATALTLTDDGVVQALAGTAFYAACIAAMGVGLGFILRSTASGAGVVVTTLLIAPLMMSLLPSSIGDPIGQLLPSNAAAAVTGMGAQGAELLSVGGGIAVLLAWVGATLTGAAVVLRRRDA